MASSSLPPLTLVRDIDWSDNKLGRVSIIPIYDDGIHQWAGIAVNNYGTTLTTIGGSFESVDFDLLSTVVREWNEEVGENLGDLLKEEDLFNHYAIITESGVCIFKRVFEVYKFQSTPEIYTLIWVTGNQIKSILDNDEAFLVGRLKAFPVSISVKKLLSYVPFYLNDDRLYLPLDFDTTPFPRSPFIPRARSFRIYKDLDFFVEQLPKISLRYQAVIISPNFITVSDYLGDTYQLSIEDQKEIWDALKFYNVKIRVGKKEDETIVKNMGINISNISALTRLLEKNKMKKELKEFLQNLKHIQNLPEEPRIYQEIDLIYKYDLMIYESNKKKKHMFNDIRACFFTLLDLINFQVGSGILYQDLEINTRTLNRCYNILESTKLGLDTVVSYLIDMKILNYNSKTTLLTIP